MPKFLVAAFGDLHLTAYPPRWRVDKDTFLDTQIFMLEFGIRKAVEQAETGVVVFPGDIFHKRREDHNAAMFALIEVVRGLPAGWIALTTLGQHDMAAKSVELYESKSALAIVEKACKGKLCVLKGGEVKTVGSWEFRGCAYDEDETAAWLKGDRAWKTKEGVSRVLIVHASIGNEAAGDWQQAASGIAPDCDVVIAGDIHSGIDPQKCASGATVFGAGVLSWMRMDESGHPPMVGFVRKKKTSYAVDTLLLPHPELEMISVPEARDEQDGGDEQELEQMLEKISALRSRKKMTDEELLSSMCDTMKASKPIRKKAKQLLKEAKEAVGK